MQLELHQQKVLEFLLQKEYFSEFKSIDGWDRHPDGINFYEWLYKKGLISKEHLNLQLSLIEDVDYED